MASIIKGGKTRISIWESGTNSRCSKIELSKIIITNGYDRTRKYLCHTLNFNNIDDGILILKHYLNNKHIHLSVNDIQNIKIYYTKLNKYKNIMF